ASAQSWPVPRSQLVNATDQKDAHVIWQTPDGSRRVAVLGLDLAEDESHKLLRLLIDDPASNQGRWIKPNEIIGEYHVQVPRPRAIMSVIVDRAIGLIALIILGGIMAAWQYFTADAASAAIKLACGRIALASGLLIAGVLLGLEIIAQPHFRKAVGLDFLLR